MSIFSSVIEAFEAVARQQPTFPALIDITGGGDVPCIVSYGQLLAVCAQAARIHWKEKNQVIAVAIEEGRDLVAVELAVWMAEGAVCPFDVRRDPRADDVMDTLQPDLIVIANSKCFSDCPRPTAYSK